MNSLSSLALVAKAGKFDSRMIYAGWSENGLPILTTDITELSEESLSQAKTFIQSGFPIPSLPIKRRLGVVVVEFAGPVQDLKDPSPKNLIQDTIKVLVKNSKGETEELTLGELEILQMIGNNVLIFQRFGTILDTSDRQEAVSFFSFFLPGNDSSEDQRQDFLLLIKPTNDNLGNLIDGIVFIQDVLKKLLMNDERQPREFKKGYADAGHEAEEEIKNELLKSKGVFGFLFVPDDPTNSGDSLMQMIKDFVYVPADGSKPKNPLLAPTKKIVQVVPDRKSFDKLRLTAAKMYLYARSRIKTFQ